ncbi:glycosyltransferase family 2 protein [Micropruina sp.]|uniref:glycosyltransferase family 2 protein n=1 Tax=Micropruina sp. TaxID=2737536 RepID=UPI0039E53225
MSIIIPNHNYADFVGAAIESALVQDWPDVEVIVVDDASSDDSRRVIAEFGDRIDQLFLTENVGQRVACNKGFARSTGEAVIFLDSDDMLLPDCARLAAEALAPGVSKVQYQVRRVDNTGADTGTETPRFSAAIEPARIRFWYDRTSAYPTPPGSGNAYARWFLERIMPLGELPDARFIDSALLSAAPVLGDVVTIPRPLALYRRHDRNDSALLVDPSRFHREVERGFARALYAEALCDPPGAQSTRRCRRSRELLGFRVAARRLTPHLPAPLPDARRTLLLDIVLSPFHPGPESIRHRALLGLWCLAVLLSPKRLVLTLIKRRYRA